MKWLSDLFVSKNRLLLMFIFDIYAAYSIPVTQLRNVQKERWQPAYCAMYGLSNFFKEIVYLHEYLFTPDTIKIMTAALPFYLSSRMIDENIHSHFYDPSCHKNIRQLPDSFTKAVEHLAFYGVVGLSSMAVWGPRADLRTTGRIFAVGAISGLYLKDFIKSFKSNGNLRPFNQNFSPTCRSQGGFPSGHMFEAAYMATVFGLQYGLGAWIPLSLFSGAMFVVSVNANRHYVSQVFAGAALGIIYGVAASKTIDDSLNGGIWDVGIRCDSQGNPAVQVAYNF